MPGSTPNSQVSPRSRSGACSVCLVQRHLHIRNGTIFLHGPRHCPCPGSNKPPLQGTSGSACSQLTISAVSGLTSISCPGGSLAADELGSACVPASDSQSHPAVTSFYTISHPSLPRPPLKTYTQVVQTRMQHRSNRYLYESHKRCSGSGRLD